jgi:hypothetical protein
MRRVDEDSAVMARRVFTRKADGSTVGDEAFAACRELHAVEGAQLGVAGLERHAEVKNGIGMKVRPPRGSHLRTEKLTASEISF